MPPPKKAAKKAAAKHAPHDDPATRDRRRAHEHLGRVEALHKAVEKPAAKQIGVLTELAREQIGAGHPKEAADLLRAAEHLSFGSLHAPTAEEVDPRLEEELTTEFDSKLEKAGEHWSDEEDHLEGLEEVFTHAKGRAQKAFEAGSYRQALELARAAEALSHVTFHEADEEGNGEAEPDEDETEE